jgi:hydrogenase maturation protein HypF
MPPTDARRIVLSGRVQGVGFRPFVYRTAHELGIHGWVLNGAGKVLLHAEGTPRQLNELEAALIDKAPPLAQPRLDSSTSAVAEDFEVFEIRASEGSEAPEICVPPDLFTCDECIAELTDPRERRYRYPFINCTQCGPRYTLITAMPYDRPNTSMADFPLCDACRAEYESPLDRRFHAQPLACAACGPSLRFGRDGQWIEGNTAALDAAVTALQNGQIIAMKGVGGYHLVCNARDDSAVGALRQRKHRPDKPLAVMFPWEGSDGLGQVRRYAAPDRTEAEQLTCPARPIVLVRKSKASALCAGVSKHLAEVGAFLPYSPLHYRLLHSFGGPVVATSGNLSGEPVITDEAEAERRLAGICDAFLHHDRPIVRPADDPVVRVIAGRPQLIRPGRGLAPLEMELPAGDDLEPVVALGGHMKNTIALAWGRRVVVSPHIGELDSPRSMAVFEQVISDLQALYGIEAKHLLCDQHPNYASTRWAGRQTWPSTGILHHHAHASAVAGEHPDIGNWLVFAWDGVGFGANGELWGGETLAGHPGNWRRVASFRPLRLLGGDRAAREPWRSAAGLMWGSGYDWTPPVEQAELAKSAFEKGQGLHETSAVGRLFDAAAALILGRYHASFEGQGPMELEAVATPAAQPVPLNWIEDDDSLLRCDPSALLLSILDTSRSPAERASVFHASLADALVRCAVRLRSQLGFGAVGLSGGVFQNRVLTENVLAGLRTQDIPVRLHRQVPSNDAGICYGQVIEYLAQTGKMAR